VLGGGLLAGQGYVEALTPEQQHQVNSMLVSTPSCLHQQQSSVPAVAALAVPVIVVSLSFE
jgi:hypothetical protein